MDECSWASVLVCSYLCSTGAQIWALSPTRFSGAPVNVWISPFQPLAAMLPGLGPCLQYSERFPGPWKHPDRFLWSPDLSKGPVTIAEISQRFFCWALLMPPPPQHNFFRCRDGIAACGLPELSDGAVAETQIGLQVSLVPAAGPILVQSSFPLRPKAGVSRPRGNLLPILSVTAPGMPHPGMPERDPGEGQAVMRVAERDVWEKQVVGKFCLGRRGLRACQVCRAVPLGWVGKRYILTEDRVSRKRPTGIRQEDLAQARGRQSLLVRREGLR